jgi:hypothetical protein
MVLHWTSVLIKHRILFVFYREPLDSDMVLHWTSVLIKHKILFVFYREPLDSDMVLHWTSVLIKHRILFVFYREPLDADMVLHSTFVLLKHRILPIDLVMLQTPTGQVYSFLSVAWGILADIDYESEKLRAIGSTRFTLYAIMRLLSKSNW